MRAGPLNLQDLDRNYLVIVQLKTQAPGVIHQVTLRQDKIHDGLIRLGETPNDEIVGWQFPENLHVLSVIGVAEQNAKGEWGCKPLLEVVTEAA